MKESGFDKSGLDQLNKLEKDGTLTVHVHEDNGTHKTRLKLVFLTLQAHSNG